MSSVQEGITHEVLGAVHDFLGGPTPDGDEWRFQLREHLQSNWGAVYGGALAAAVLTVARAATPERSPRSMHIQMVRAVPSGKAWATATVRHPGRTVATVEVDLYGERRKLAAIALLTMVTPTAVANDYDRADASPPFRIVESPLIDANLMSGAMDAPIVSALKMGGLKGSGGFLRADNVRSSVDGSMAAVVDCIVPWENLEFTGPEAACLVSDTAVGLPVTLSYIPVADIGPNADLTLRFTTAPATRRVTAAASMLSVQRGTTTVGIEVQAGDKQLAHALSTSLLLHSS
jgi:acyl-coenzyme A thioesterase PaaI-like protein